MVYRISIYNYIRIYELIAFLFSPLKLLFRKDVEARCVPKHFALVSGRLEHISNTFVIGEISVVATINGKSFPKIITIFLESAHHRSVIIHVQIFDTIRCNRLPFTKYFPIYWKWLVWIPVNRRKSAFSVKKGNNLIKILLALTRTGYTQNLQFLLTILNQMQHRVVIALLDCLFG